MATPVGADQLTSLSRRFILPEIPDQVYGSNGLFARWNQGRRREIPGGYQIELPIIHQAYTTGGPITEWGIQTITPQDNVVSAAWDWKQHEKSVAISSLRMTKANSPEAKFSLLKETFEEAEMSLADDMGVGLMSDGTTNPAEIDGLALAVDSTGTYAGLLRSTYPVWAANEDSTTATLTPAAIRSMFANCKNGGRNVTVIVSEIGQWSRFLALGEASQEHPVGSGGADPQLLSLGFTNGYFMNVPWMEDSHTFDGPDANNSAVLCLNEFYIDLGVNPGMDFVVYPFVQAGAGTQLGWTCSMEWQGNLINRGPQFSGKLTNISA
jgi:hypothetical protein